MATDKTSQWLSDRIADVKDADYRQKVKDAILDFHHAYNPDSFHIEPPMKQQGTEREPSHTVSSQLQYISVLHRTAQWVDLIEATARDLNLIAQQRKTGKHDSTKDDGLSTNTIHADQTSWRTFYRFHDQHPEGAATNVDPDDIVLVDRDTSSVDERDMFDSDEIKALREATQNKRDRALLEFLIFTGQRHNALRKLKVRDIQPDEGQSGKLYIPDEEGMKGAEGKRPLLGAEKAARDWLDSHPTGEPDDAFFTHVYDWSGHDNISPGDHLSRDSIGNIPQRIGDRAGVEKPCNPHNFRHYFVTMAVANHGMSMDTVRHLIGHAPGSRELEETYQHLVDEDHIKSAELDMGIRESRSESFTPAKCFTCNEPLQPEWNSCPNCSRIYGPEVEEAKDDAKSRKTDAATEITDSEKMEQLMSLMEAMGDAEAEQIARIADTLDQSPKDFFSSKENSDS
jgi:site-specific recombinase XerD